MNPQGVMIGAAYLLIAQLAFVFSGYIIHIGLGRLLGPSEYGVYSVIIYIITIFNLILTTGIPQAVSKFVSEDEVRSRTILKTSSNFSMFLGLAMFMLTYTGAELIASYLNDPDLAPYIRAASVMIPGYSLFTIIIGYYNGLRYYKIQSYLLLSYNFIKPTMIFLFVFMGFSVWGAILGFALSPLIPLIIGIYMIGIRSFAASNGFPLKTIIMFAIPILIFSIAINLITSIDLLLVKRILMNNEQVGYYSAASTISKLPYFLMVSINMAIFPAVSASIRDFAKTRDYINESIRYSLIFILPIAAMIAATSESLVTLLYSDTYQPAYEALEILIVGISLLSLFSILATIISAAGKPHISMYLGIIIIIIDYLINVFIIPIWGMVGAAVATSLASAIGVAMAAFYVYSRYGTLVSPFSAVRIMFASALIYLILSLTDLSGLYLLSGYLVMGLCYIGLLFVMSEIEERDIRRIKEIIPVSLIR
jgi:O-antigen/teichoic acid export membrane protein